MQLQYNNIKITSIEAFGNIRGRTINNCKNVYFVRCIGTNSSYTNTILSLDKKLSSNDYYKYLRIEKLPIINDTSIINYYSEKYNEWSNGKSSVLLKYINDIDTNVSFSNACSSVCKLFKSSYPNYNHTIEKNFVISLMWWFDCLLSEMLKDSKKFNKLVYYGKVTIREYLFCYLATLMGIDVMILLPFKDVLLDKNLMDKSYAFKIGDLADICIPCYNAGVDNKQEKKVIVKSPPPTQPKVTIIHTPPQPQNNNSKINRVASPNTVLKREMPFEELASLASSVVMIAIHNSMGEIIGTGSGIAINSTGYILTNYHVINKGAGFSIRLENDNNVYNAHSVIKYHSVIDLALLKIDRQLKPLKIYNSTKNLLRGQKVVAIGSPLGLFNSVSDGIISGFRTVDNIDMIQFTAPISSGSSGGGVLNMYGEVIGISTANCRDGQNINLAVSYTQILPFIQGFI